MYRVIFRKPNELLTSMFNKDFKTKKEAKAFIAKDAEWYAESHGFSKSSMLVNEDPDCGDYFMLYSCRGKAAKEELVYQYFCI